MTTLKKVKASLKEGCDITFFCVAFGQNKNVSFRFWVVQYFNFYSKTESNSVDISK